MKEEIQPEQIWNREKMEGLKSLINMMKDDEELGLYEEPFKHEFKVLTKEEVMEGRSSAYEFIDFDKQELGGIPKGKVDMVVGKTKQELEPLEVPMPVYKQETLEEAAERLNPYVLNGRTPFKEGFIASAEWKQERMYSEEEVLKILHDREQYLIESVGEFYQSNYEWFEQVKKK